jgi:hypothetical protein
MRTLIEIVRPQQAPTGTGRERKKIRRFAQKNTKYIASTEIPRSPKKSKTHPNYHHKAPLRRQYTPQAYENPHRDSPTPTDTHRDREREEKDKTIRTEKHQVQSQHRDPSEP